LDHNVEAGNPADAPMLAPAIERVTARLGRRTGSEGRISCLKRDFGWNRTRIDGLDGARTWCGHGVFNHNLVKIAALATPTTA
jgi:IS5 family transposase